MDEMINETTEMEDITTGNDEITQSYDEEGSLLGTAFILGGAFVGGIVFGKFVVPAVGKAVNSAREALVNFLTKDDADRVVIEDVKSEDKTESTDK